MRHPSLKISALLLIFIAPCIAQESNSVALQTSCAHWSKLRLDKRKQFKGDSDDLYQTGVCRGYFEGLMDGMDNTGGWQLSDGTPGSFQIKRASISSSWDVVRAFYAYVDATPLAKGKPAWSTLQHVLVANGLASFTPQNPEAQTSNLSSECKTGATNVLNEFNADSELKTVDTATLISTTDKLVGCLTSSNLNDADKALTSTATAEVQLVLVSRAVNVMSRNSILAEFKAERRSSSGSNKPVSNVRGATEQ